MSLTIVKSNAEAPVADGSRKAIWALEGHNDDVLSAAAHKNLFATCSADGVALVWRLRGDGAKGPENVCRVSTGGPAVVDVCFIDDKRLATAQGDACVSLWDLETGKRTASVSRITVPGRASWPVVNAVATVGVDTLCFGGDDGYVAMADTRSPRVTSSVNRKAPVTALRVAEEEGTLFAGDACGRVCGFDPRMSWRKFMDTKCSSDVVASVACGAKADQVAVYTMDGKVSLVDTQPFAVDQQERVLASLQLEYGEDRTIKRGDWSDALDAIIFPGADGSVACVAPSRFSTGVTRSLHGSAGAEEEEAGGQLYFAKVVQERYVLLGGTASLLLKEL